MPVEKYSISLRPETAAAIAIREGERSTVINRSLERYFHLLDVSRRKLADLITDNEMAMILDVMNGTMFAEPFSLQIVAREIEDSLPDGYAEKWDVDGAALIQKLDILNLTEKFALVDAVERWWFRVGNGEQPTFGEALKPIKRK